MQVLRIKLTHLHNDEWYEFHDDFKRITEKHGEDALNITDLRRLYLTQLDKADKKMLVIRKSVYTKEMQMADKERDTLFGSFHRVVKDSLNLPDAEKKEAAGRVYNLVHTYKQNGLKGGYNAESSNINNLLEDLDGYTADLSLLALNEWVSALRQAEDKFLALRSQRIEEAAGKPQGLMIDIRRQVDMLYHSMVSILDAKLVADGLGGDITADPDDLDAGTRADDDPTPAEPRGNTVYNCVVEWNVIVRSYHSVLAARASRLANKKQQDASNPSSPEMPAPLPVPPESHGTDLRK